MEDSHFRQLITAAGTWRDGDPDPHTRAEIERLVREASTGGLPARDVARAELADRFRGPLPFGTAGLRGPMGAGPNRMNRAVVIRTSRGLADHLRGALGPDPARVVVGFDGRHRSEVFAHDCAAVLRAAGAEVLELPRPLPTPVLAFAVRHLDCDAGVMITASHNPARDNGYKVYLGGRIDPGPGRGAQLAPPVDRRIADRIALVGRALDVNLTTRGRRVLGEDLVEAYLDAAMDVPTPGSPRQIRVVMTPLHGVAGTVLTAALVRAGFPAPIPVPEQADPDPDFPTVPFPNPEEPGALDRALALATAEDADLVIATDPDGDRCAVAVPWNEQGSQSEQRSRDDQRPRDDRGHGASPDGGRRRRWRILHGDEVGALLGEHLLSRPVGGRRGGEPGADTVATTVVSSRLLARIAAAHGVRHRMTLTGFKWLARVPGLLYAYEEAIGYCAAPAQVRDKDGITAALLVAELAAGLRAAGSSLPEALGVLAARHGMHATEQVSWRLAGSGEAGALMARLREAPPRSLAGLAVTSVQDLSVPGNGDLPPTDALRWYAGDDLRVIVRPSGTEPRIKCYLEAVLPVDGQDSDLLRSRCEDVLAATASDLTNLLTPGHKDPRGPHPA